MSSPWRMESKCKTCPFHEEGPGRELRDSLARGRWDSILAALEAESTFNCHSTIDYDALDEADEWDDEEEEGDERLRRVPGLLCAGAIEYQEENECVSNYQRVAERLEYFAKRRADAAR